ncbi:MAG TPA: nucleotidyltransferase family protein [Terriglobales bacterium]|nr:nucleotidyltransferase family protein [Terriglobales bacterium]
MIQRAIHPIILAAGRSSRLGFPKATARFGDRTAIEIAVENCAGLAPPIVVLGYDAARLRKAVPRTASVEVNRRWRRGQTTSLLAGLRRVPRDADFMLYPLDFPLLTPAVVRRLVAGFRRRNKAQAIAAPSFRRRAGHPVIFAAKVRKELETADSAREVVYRDLSRIRFVPVRTSAIWLDFDTPAAYRRRVREYMRYHARKDRKAGRKGRTR